MGQKGKALIALAPAPVQSFPTRMPSHIQTYWSEGKEQTDMMQILSTQKINTELYKTYRDIHFIAYHVFVIQNKIRQ